MYGISGFRLPEFDESCAEVPRPAGNKSIYYIENFLKKIGKVGKPLLDFRSVGSYCSSLYSFWAELIMELEMPQKWLGKIPYVRIDSQALSPGQNVISVEPKIRLF